MSFGNKNKKFEVWALIIMLSLIWGSSFILIKKGLESFSPAQVGTARMAFAFIVMLPFAIKHLKEVSPNRWKTLFFSGMIGNLIPAILFAIAETNLESSLTGVLNALSPLFTLIIAVYIFSYKIKTTQIIGLILGFIGTIGLSFVNQQGGFGKMNAYVWLVVLATLCYGINLNFIKAYLGDLSSLVNTSLAMFFIGPFSIFYLLATDFFFIVKNGPGAIESLAYIAILGIFGTAIALIMYTRVILLTTPVFASVVTFIIPIVAVIWGLIAGEVLYPLHIIGMAIILCGIYFVNKSQSFKEETIVIKNED